LSQNDLVVSFEGNKPGMPLLMTRRIIAEVALSCKGDELINVALLSIVLSVL
jgi:hypothetical protein